MRKTASLDSLSFIVRKPGGAGFDYWAVQPTGAYGTDWEKGRTLGNEFLAFIGQRPTNGNATLLGCIVDAMMRRRSEPRTNWGQHITGLEIGFLATINEHAMTTAALMAGSLAA